MKFRLLILLFMIATCSTTGQVLYKCESPGKDTTTWLLGTCHMLPKKQFRYDALIDSIIGKTDLFFSEVFLKPKDTSYVRQLTLLRQRIVYFPEGQSLADRVTVEELDLLAGFYKQRFNLSKKNFKKYMRYLPLSMHQQITNPGKEVVKMDNLVSRYAYGVKKKVVLLDNVESIAMAYAILNKLYDARWLVDKVKHFDRSAVKDSLLTVAYLNQDTVLMKRLIKEAPAEENQVVVSQRNEQWKRLIEQHSTRCNFLFAGIAHLLIDGDGLLDYYLKKGYTISAVSITIRR